MTDKQLSDSDIISYLNDNSDFFIRHPEQLIALKVNNKDGRVASLVNHQVNVLKDRNNQLKSRLAELIKYAGENEKIMSQVFELSLQLCQISHVSNITKHFSKFVKQSFDSDLFRMVLPQSDKLETSKHVLCVNGEKQQQMQTVFKDFLTQDNAICGRLKLDKMQFVFGSDADKVGSSVVLPIGKNANKGLLVFASFDEERFNPDMSTDLLAKLTQILDKKFNQSFEKTDKQVNESQ